MTSKLALKLGVVAILFALAGGSLFAAPACATGTLQSYVLLGATGCSIGDKIFSNFADTLISIQGTLNPSNPPNPLPTTIYVAPIASGNLGLNIYYYFGANTVAFDQTMDLFIQYQVNVGPGYNITSVYTSPDGGLTASGTVGAANIATQNLCLGAAFSTQPLGGTDASHPPLCGGTAVANVLGQNTFNLTGLYPSNPAGTITLASGQTVLGVSDEVFLYGGTANPNSGGATERIDSITNQFVQSPTGGVPEPATFLLLGSALLGLGVLRRKSV
jgi:hypothetical protein